MSFGYILSNRNRLKPLIITQAEKYTGCKLAIDDDLSFSFFPFFAVKINHIQLQTPNESPLSSIKLDIKNIIVHLKLIPLLQGKFKTGAIQIDQLTVNQLGMKSSIQLNKIKLNSSAYDQLTNTFLTNLSFDFTENNLLGHITISGDVTINRKNNICFIKNISSNLFMNNANLSDLTMKGELSANNLLENPTITGHFTLQSPNIKKLLEQFGILNLKSENLIDIDSSTAEADLLANNETFDLQSTIHIPNTKIANINLDDVNLKLHFKNNILNLESIKANLYGGTLNGEVILNLESHSPTITAHLKTLNIQIEPLFKLIQMADTDIHLNTKFLGTGDIELNVSAKGLNVDEMIKNLNGTSHVNITNGILMGTDWDDIITRFFSSNNAITQEMIPQSFHAFRFKRLSASFTINNGDIVGNDLLLTSSDLIIKGKGNINLTNNSIDYELQTALQNPLEYEEIYNNLLKPLPTTIHISSKNGITSQPSLT